MGFLDSTRNLLTDVISVVSPKRAFQRQRYLTATNTIRAYEAAAHTRRTAGWKTTSASATEESRGAINTLRNRSRDLFRNNPYAKRAIEALADNLVGSGIRPSPLSAGKTADKRIKKLWAEWANKVWCDYDGKFNLYGLQWLAAKTLFESGEVLIVKRKTADKRLPVPIQLQVIEADYIDTSKDFRAMKPGDKEIIQGVEYDDSGRRVAYYLYDRHPGDGWGLTSKRVPVEDVLHVYPVERPGQVRGVPVGTSSMIRLRDFDEYEDAQLIRQKIAACFAAFVTDDPDADVAGSPKQTDELEKLEPGIIEYLPTGKQITFANPPSTEGYDVYTRTILRAVATGYGVTYEMMTGDLSNVNFSSGRMGWIEFHRLITRFQELLFIPQFCDPVWDWFMEAAVIGLQLRSTQVTSATWTAPRREMIDPVKEVQGMKEQMRTGLIPWQEMVRQNGYDPEEVLQMLSDDKKAFDGAGLKFEWDPEVPLKGSAAPGEDKPEDKPGDTKRDLEEFVTLLKALNE